MVANCISIPKVVKFKSEYEHVHGASPITDPAIVPCMNVEHMHTLIAEELTKRYDS